MLVDLEVTKFYDEEYKTHLLTKDSYKILKYKGLVKAPRKRKLFTDEEYVNEK